MEIKNKLIKIMGFSYASFVLVRLLGFLFITIAFYNGGKEFLGEWFFILAIVGYFKYGWDALGQSFTKKMASEYSKNNLLELKKDLNGGFIIMCLVGLISALILFLFNYFLINHFAFTDKYLLQYHIIFNAIAVYVFFASLTVPLQSLMAAMQRNEIVHFIEAFQAILTTTLSILVVFVYPRLIWIVIIFTFVQIMIFIVYIVLKRSILKYKTEERFILPDMKSFKEQFAFSFYLLLLSVSGILLFQVDIILIAFFLPASLVAIYGICQKIYNFPMELSLRITTGLLPATSYFHGQGALKSIKELFLKTTKYTMIIYFSLGLTLLFHQWFNINHSAGLHVMKGLGRIKELLIYSWLCSIINVALSFFLIKKYGLVGVALGTTVPFVLFECYLLGSMLRHLKIKWSEYFKRILFPIYFPVIIVLVIHFWFFNVDSFNLITTAGAFVFTSVGIFLTYLIGLNAEEKGPIIYILNHIKLFIIRKKQAANAPL